MNKNRMEQIKRAVRDCEGSPEVLEDKNGSTIGIFIPSDCQLFASTLRRMGGSAKTAKAQAQVQQFLSAEVFRIGGPWNAHSVELDVLWVVFHQWRRALCIKAAVSNRTDFNEALCRAGIRLASGKAWTIALKCDLLDLSPKEDTSERWEGSQDHETVDHLLE